MSLLYRIGALHFLLFMLSFQPRLEAQPDNPPANYTNTTMRTWLRQNWYNGYEYIGMASDGYAAVRLMMYNVIDNEGGQLHCIYSRMAQPIPQGGYSDADAAWPFNCEHLVPQSIFNEQYPMKNDAHHLRPSFNEWNSDRSNYPFSDIPDNDAEIWIRLNEDINCDNSSPCIPGSFIDEYTEIELSGDNSRCEPREDAKGNIARSVFYFFTMYPAYPISEVGDIATLYQWHLADPVDAQEQNRNGLVENFQGNRNPYIDHPEWVYKAWIADPISGIDTDTEASTTMNILSSSLDTDHLILSVQSPILLKGKLDLLDITGKLWGQMPFAMNNKEENIALPITHLPAGLYFIRLGTDNGYTHSLSWVKSAE